MTCRLVPAFENNLSNSVSDPLMGIGDGFSLFPTREWLCYCSVPKSCLTLRSPQTAGRQLPLSSTIISWSLLKFTSIESVLLSNHFILRAPFSVCLQPLPPSGSFPMSRDGFSVFPHMDFQAPPISIFPGPSSCKTYRHVLKTKLKISKHFLDPVWILQSPPPHSQALWEVNACFYYSYNPFFIYHSFFPATHLRAHCSSKATLTKVTHAFQTSLTHSVVSLPPTTIHFLLNVYAIFVTGGQTFVLETISCVGHCDTSVSCSLSVLLELGPFDMLEC